MSEPHFDDDIEQIAQHPTVRHAAVLKSSASSVSDRKHWKRNAFNMGDITYDAKEIRERDAAFESARCLKCADAPCVKSCPCHIDIPKFQYAISKEDYYAAAKIIYSDNPLGLACGFLCAGSELCQGGCNLAQSHEGYVEIPAMQRFACEQFLRMKIPQIRDPSLPKIGELPKSYATPIALVGAGPASLSCAHFLARLGYQKVTIYEKEGFAGGILAKEIPDFRMPYDALKKEIDEIVLGLPGVEIKYNTPVDKLDTLIKESGAVFLGQGLPEPFTLPFLKEAQSDAWNVTTSKDWLLQVSHLMKKVPVQTVADNVKPAGHVVILGGGDVAFNCAAAAFKLGAERVTIAFRENFPQIPASWEELVVGLREKIDFVANAAPTGVVYDEIRASPKRTKTTKGLKTVTGLNIKFQSWDNHKPVFAGDGTATLQGDYFVVAFGAKAGAAEYLNPVKLNKYGMIDVDPDTQAVQGVEKVFAGGDAAGNHTVVEAVNDGKTAAWFMHKAIQEATGVKVPEKPALPRFFTAVDEVDVGVDVLGLHFLNPFGLSSATPVTSVGMIKRSFDAGFSFAVTKTMTLDKDITTNVSPRIVRSTSGLPRGPNQVGFLNIELLTEKTVKYWQEGIRNMKKHYPKHIVICSIMAKHNKEDWQAITRAGQECGSDALELNVSCPHVGKKGMGALAGQSEETVEEITRWVKDVATIPVITKLTPNVTNIARMAEAALKGGADAVSAINTVSGIVTIRRDGTMWPSVGKDKLTAYGGVSGNMIRPIGLKAVVSTKEQQSTKDLPILGIGGIDSADSALQYILGGAHVVQMTSSIQNQDYTIVDEMIHGLKAHLYFKARADLKDNVKQYMPVTTTPGPVTLPYPTVESEVGRAANRIRVLPQLDLNTQVKANVDEDICFKCGKCYMTCNDTGYQAIILDPMTHIPTVTDKCMGCGLCMSVCPADCIEYKAKAPGKHAVDRGIPNPAFKMPYDPK